MSDDLNTGPVAITRTEAIFDAAYLLMFVKCRAIKGQAHQRDPKVQKAAEKFRELLIKCDINPAQFEAAANEFLRDWVDGPSSSPLAIPNTKIILPN